MAVFIDRVCHTGQSLYRLINKLTTPSPRSTSGGWAGRGGSTRPHPESPRPSRHAATPGRSDDRATFFSCVVRIRTRHPVFRPLPIGPQTVQGPADRFITQTPLRDALLVANLGSQRERPEARGLARGARGLMQDMLELLTLGGGEGWHHTLGPRRRLGYTSQAGRVKGLDDIADGLHTAPYQLRKRLWRQPAGTPQHNLGTPRAEGFGRGSFP